MGNSDNNKHEMLWKSLDPFKITQRVSVERNVRIQSAGKPYNYHFQRIIVTVQRGNALSSLTFLFIF